MADYNTILYEVERGRARITLNRPEKLNALSFELQTELNQALWDADNDTEVHVVILRGAGRAFSAGGDMWSGLYPDDDPAPGGPEVQKRIWGLAKPVIAAVRGHAVGQGCELAGACDLTVASETARFGEIQIRHGFPPPMLITPYLTSMKHAKEIMLLGEVYDAHEAKRLGLANTVVADDQLEAAAEAMAKKIAKLPANVVRLNKALTNRVYELAGIDSGLAWNQVDSLQEIASARDSAADQAHRVRETQGWAAFKEERDRGYERR